MSNSFRRPHHTAISAALRCLDGELFAEAECFFGGGTAIVLKLGEYRESVDIDFLCASRDGYRRMRQAVFAGGVTGLIRPGSTIAAVRDLKADQYGIRTALKINDTIIKFEIVRESRVELNGFFDTELQVPVLVQKDMYMEKLLANADRWKDKAALSRDIIDLSMMISRWGDIPREAWEGARAAYGETIDASYVRAVSEIRKPDWLRECMKKMAIDEDLFDEILRPHGGPDSHNGSL